MTIMEAAWDCASCSKKLIPGHLKECPQCGSPWDAVRDPKETRYLPDNARVVTDPDEVRRAYIGPDRRCRYCFRASPADAMECGNCGRTLDGEDKTVPVVTYRGGNEPPTAVRSLDELPRESPAARRQPAADVQDLEPEDPEIAATWFQLHWPKLAAAAAAMVVLLGVFFVYQNFLKTETSVLTVSELTWERQLSIEEYRTVQDSGWSIPDGGRHVRDYQDVYEYVKVFDGYDYIDRVVTEEVYSHAAPYDCGDTYVDLGNGYIDKQDVICYEDIYNTYTYTVEDPVARYRDDPVYRTKFDYDIERWVFSKWEVASGGDGESDQPRWPGSEFLKDNQRVGLGKSEKYVVVMTSSNGRTYTEEPGLEVWARLDLEDEVSTQMNAQGDLRDISWPVE